jgi:hypothetical protein
MGSLWLLFESGWLYIYIKISVYCKMSWILPCHTRFVNDLFKNHISLRRPVSSINISETLLKMVLNTNNPQTALMV